MMIGSRHYFAFVVFFCGGLVAGMYADAAEGLDETALIAVLESDASWAAKYDACTGLRRVGTAKSVPALAALLTDDKLSHMARYALEAMPCSEAGKALRDALSRTSGLSRIGVVTSIGARRDPKAVSLLLPLVADSDVELAQTAAAALGRIGTAGAAQGLSSLRGTVPSEVELSLAEGLLAAGARMASEKSIYAAQSWLPYFAFTAARPPSRRSPFTSETATTCTSGCTMNALITYEPRPPRPITPNVSRSLAAARPPEESMLGAATTPLAATAAPRMNCRRVQRRPVCDCFIPITPQSCRSALKKDPIPTYTKQHQPQAIQGPRLEYP